MESEVDDIGSLSGLISIFLLIFPSAIFLSLLDRDTDNKIEDHQEVINYIEIFALYSFLNFFFTTEITLGDCGQEFSKS